MISESMKYCITLVERLEQARFRGNHSWNPMVASNMDTLMEQDRFS
ncbi:MAG: hypothetical protein R8M38_00270 [Mariprofundaceae bacterium]